MAQASGKHNETTPGYLEQTLYWAAREEAHKALQMYADDANRSQREACLAVGMAAEYLVGAALAHVDPVLLADFRNPESMVMLSRFKNGAASLDLKVLRTAPMAMKLKVLTAAHPAVNVKTDVDNLMIIRNSAAHAALANGEALADAVVALVRVVDALHGVLPHRDPNNFWGQNLSPVVAEMRDARSTAVRQRARSKVARALQDLEAFLAGLDVESRERTMASLERRSHRVMGGDVDKPWQCPACHRQGAVSYVKEQGVEPRIETDYDRSGELESVYAIVDVTGIPTLFECPVCGLVLEDEELGVFPPMDQDVELEEEVADPSEFATGDWDDY